MAPPSTLRSPWAIDRGLAADLSAALGWQPDDGAQALAEVLPRRVPCGSTAKLEAVAAGDVPPGAEPGPLARTILGHLDGAGGGPTPSWSCWVHSTVMAALVGAGGSGPVRVAATRRIDEGGPIVDVHSSVLVTEDRGDGAGTVTWLCDPYFGSAVALPEEPGAAGEGERPLVHARAERELDGRWTHAVRLARWDLELRYRVLGPELDAGDVRAFCAVSVTHSGVASRPYVRLHDPDAIIDARVDEHGTGICTDWRVPGVDGPVSPHVLETTSWPEAAAAFTARTGVAVR
jgi:hypothetical protein